MNAFKFLQDWYSQHCDGDWEHQSGVQLHTLDNPGWRLTINLAGTELEHRPFSEVKIDRTESDWLRCWVENGMFESACGADSLDEILAISANWASSPEAHP